MMMVSRSMVWWNSMIWYGMVYVYGVFAARRSLVVAPVTPLSALIGWRSSTADIANTEKQRSLYGPILRGRKGQIHQTLHHPPPFLAFVFLYSYYICQLMYICYEPSDSFDSTFKFFAQ